MKESVQPSTPAPVKKERGRGADLALLFDNPIWEDSRLWAGASRQNQQKQGVALRSIWAGFAHTGEYARECFEEARLREV